MIGGQMAGREEANGIGFTLARGRMNGTGLD